MPVSPPPPPALRKYTVAAEHISGRDRLRICVRLLNPAMIIDTIKKENVVVYNIVH
jgi:hypothetical protein